MHVPGTRAVEAAEAVVSNHLGDYMSFVHPFLKAGLPDTPAEVECQKRLGGLLPPAIAQCRAILAERHAALIEELPYVKKPRSSCLI